jgi:hypothetical protein
VQSPCNSLIEDYTTDKGDISSIQCKMSLRGRKSIRKVDGLNLIFHASYVPALTPRLNSTEPSLQLSKNIALFAICLIYVVYRCHQQRDGDRPQVFEVYHLYIECTVLRTEEILWHPCLYIPWRRHFTVYRNSEFF